MFSSVALALLGVQAVAAVESSVHAQPAHDAATGAGLSVPMPVRPTMAAQMLEKYYYCMFSDVMADCSKAMTADDAVAKVPCSAEETDGLPFCGTYKGKDMLVQYLDAASTEKFTCGHPKPLAIYQGPPGQAIMHWETTTTMEVDGETLERDITGTFALTVNDDALVTGWTLMYDHTGELELLRLAEQSQSAKVMKAAKRVVKCFQTGDFDCLEELSADDCEGNEECGGDDLADVLPYCGTYKGRSCAPDFMKALSKDFQVTQYDPIEYYQGSDGEVMVSAKMGLKNVDSDEKVDAMYSTIAFSFNDDVKLTSWRCLRDHHQEAMAVESQEKSHSEKVMEAAKHVVKCFQTGDFDCLEELSADDCVGQEECGGDDLADVLPYCGTYKGKSCAPDFMKALSKDFQVTEYDPIEYYQGSDGEVMVSATMGLKNVDSDEKVDPMYSTIAFSFNDNVKLTSWRCLRDHHQEATAMESQGRVAA